MSSLLNFIFEMPVYIELSLSITVYIVCVYKLITLQYSCVYFNHSKYFLRLVNKCNFSFYIQDYLKHLLKILQYILDVLTPPHKLKLLFRVECTYIYKEDGGIRLRKCLFGLVVKCNLKFNFFILNLFDILLIQFCKSTISNYILTNDIKKYCMP